MNRRVRLLFLVIAGAAAPMLAAQQRATDTAANPLAGSPAAIAAGNRLFQQTCAGCHSDPNRAPSLSTGRFVHGSEDAQIAQTIRTGVPGLQMPPFSGLTTEQVWQLVSFVRSLSGSIATSGSDASAVLGAGAGGDAALGETLFFGRSGCASCHEVNGRGGIVGPDLSSAGLVAGQALRQKILDPGNPSAPADGGRGGRGGARPLVVVVRTKDGREIRGVRRNEDTFSLQMVDESGRLHLLEKSGLDSVRYENRSLMPGDYATRLSVLELQNLVAYLGTLKGRDGHREAAATPDRWSLL